MLRTLHKKKNPHEVDFISYVYIMRFNSNFILMKAINYGKAKHLNFLAHIIHSSIFVGLPEAKSYICYVQEPQES